MAGPSTLAKPIRQITSLPLPALRFPLAHQSRSALCPLHRYQESPRCFGTTPVALSGHNRWSKIRHRKASADSAKSAQFSKITTEILLSLRPQPGTSGSPSPDPSSNPRLAAALEKARVMGYPRGNVESVMKRALNPSEGAALQNISYEIIGPGGQIGIIVECLTDNPNRCVSRLKEQLNRFGARLSPSSYLFERKGLIRLSTSLPPTDPSSSTSTETSSEGEEDAVFERLFDVAVEAGAEDVRVASEVEGEDDVEAGDAGQRIYEVITSSSTISEISTLLTQKISLPSSLLPLTITSAEVAYLPLNPLTLPSTYPSADERSGEDAEPGDGVEGMLNEEVAEKLLDLIEGFEEVGDVVKVWTNVEGV